MNAKALLGSKRVVLALGMIVFVAAVVAGATGAFFSDTETSTGNTFTAGAIDLQIDNESYYNGVLNDGTSWEMSDLTDELFFDFDDIKPGDWGEDTISVHVSNNDAYACAYVTKTTDAENDIVEPEAELNDTDEEGELDDELNFVWWADDGDNVLEDDEVVINEGNLGDAPIDFKHTITLADSEQNIWDGEGPLAASQTYYIGKAWCAGDLELTPVAAGQGEDPTVNPGITCDGAPVDNISQTDSTMLDVEFYAVQSRNNGEFVCGEGVVNPAPEIVFVYTDEDEFPDDNHDDNEANNQPYVTWVINGDEIDFTFHNPTAIAQPFPFEYRIDDEAGAPIPGITGVQIPSGPYAGQIWGDFYNFESVGPGSSETITLTGTDKIQVRLVIGPERDYDFGWITFEAQTI